MFMGGGGIRLKKIFFMTTGEKVEPKSDVA